jgi:ankyrin repeat protein
MTSATIKLGELISTGYRDESWRQSQDSPRYTQSLLNTIGDLLDRGADINIVVCIHTTFEGICYRLLGSDPHVDLKFEQRFFSDGWFSSVIPNTSLHMSNLSIIATPLIDAAAQDNTEAISFLYSREARVEPILGILFAAQIPIIRLWNPFLIPVRRNLYGCIQQILRRSDPQNSMVQQWVQLAFNNVAAIKGEEQLALILLRHGTQPANEELSPWSARAIIHLAYSDQTLPAALSTSTSKFIRVVSWGNLDLCALVRRDWSYQTARGPQGITSLIVAVGNASAEVCAFLLDCGANPNDHDEFGMTALMDAIYCGHEEAVNLLLARGATTKRGTNVPMKTPDPGSHPREYSEWRTTEWRTANAITCNAMGWDALHLAAYKGRPKALRALCNAGADIAALDNDGYSPLDIAMRHSQDESAHYLLNCKSPFDVRSPAASRLLTQAVMDCRYDTASKLVEANVLPSPGSRLGAGHTELDRMRKLKKRSMSLLPQSMLETGPLTDYDHPTFDLCVDCSTSLENAISRPPSQSDPKCMFCQLLIDCGRYSTNPLPEIRFNVKDGTDDELVTVFFGLTFRHPIKKVEGRFS